MKIICIGRNYLDHAKELGNKTPTSPLFFLKPDTAIQPKGHPFFIPDFSNNIHFEVELVVKISKNGKNIDEKFAHKYYEKIGIGIDFTARDIQEECKRNGLPWERAKGFDGSAQISNEFINKESLKLNDINFSLNLNNTLMQRGNSKNMIFSFDQIISYVSKYYTLKAGDLIYTGTPSGVGKVEIGDSLCCFINCKEMLRVKIK
ncbi:fumarylacetoacetate hydrolase family protein [bacterium]|jgi:2-keto-4-pentenoate hydratase/2-oxohepta-3-ene-1,7-dioic acid hydratase in catechol pathway|nr:fumarylacetoacetate hydrolase family protein [bacterium]